MRYDVVIIGGGLSGLTCGIRLQEAGKNCAIISTGQSALHFSSGAFDFLNKLPDGTRVMHPLDAIERLGGNHPYRKIGEEKIREYVADVQDWFGKSGIVLHGDVEKNHYCLSPIGIIKSAWLSFDDFEPLETADAFPYKRVAVANFAGFIDFYPRFIADALAEKGVECRIEILNIPAVEKLRTNPTEMRSANIARVFDSEAQLENVLTLINDLSEEVDAVILPAVFGLSSVYPLEYIRKYSEKPVFFISPVPPSVPGIRVQKRLQERFVELGGTFFLGDTVEKAFFDGDTVIGITTNNHSDIQFYAEQYVLASGSFFSKGIISRSNEIYEPVLNADVEYDSQRDNWFCKNVFDVQPYMSYGVKTDTGFHPLRDGVPVRNMFAIGSVLSGYNPLEEGCGSGVAILTALHVANTILISD